MSHEPMSASVNLPTPDVVHSPRKLDVNEIHGGRPELGILSIDG